MKYTNKKFVITPRPKERNNTSAAQYPHNHQQGLALVVSLVLLVAMTIMGVATLKSTRLNEKISGNAQQKAISFEAAESSIATMWSAQALVGTLEQIPNGIFNNPVPVVPPGIADQLSVDFDQTNGFGVSVDIDAGVTVQYCGEMSLPTGSGASADESQIQLSGIMFDVNGFASIAGSKARSDHIQRGYVVRPKTGRTGNCTVPGI